MGYTHYWTRKSTTQEAWDKLVDFTQKAAKIVQETVPIISEYGSNIKGPLINESGLSFNGVGDDGHEDFYLTRFGSDWNFCKTNGKPYDVLVVAVLEKAQRLEILDWSSDGDTEDHVEGMALLEKAEVK